MHLKISKNTENLRDFRNMVSELKSEKRKLKFFISNLENF
jgi:hypothetical protein